jgi:PPOX class probable F420-dependent enzyme
MPCSIPWFARRDGRILDNVAAEGLAAAPRWAQELLARARVARLGLLDDDEQPRVLPVTFAVAGEDLVTAVDSKPKRDREPARVRFLRRRPEAALTADHYDDDWDRLEWVQVMGTVRIEDLGDDPAAVQALVDKYPQYREQAPPGPLLRLEPRRVLYWRARDG